MHVLHPVIRIVSFVVLTAFLALGNAADILIAAFLLSGLYLFLERRAWPPGWRMLRRMRWLFLSIAVIYLWLTPGVPLLPVPEDWAAWLPTLEGASEGGLRIAALALMVVAANLLLQATPREQILTALRWLAAPLERIGFPHERFAVRAALTLEAVGRVQEDVRAALQAVPVQQPLLARTGAVAAAVFHAALGQAEAAPCATIILPEQAAPALRQWLVPLLLVAALSAARHLAG